MLVFIEPTLLKNSISYLFIATRILLTGGISGMLNLFFAATGLRLSLVLIHIYVTDIKRTLQALWLLGVVRSVTHEVI